MDRRRYLDGRVFEAWQVCSQGLLHNLDTRLAEKILGRLAPNQNEKVIIRNFEGLPLGVDDDAFGLDLGDCRLQEHADFASGLSFVEELLVAIAGAAEVCSAMDEGNTVFTGATEGKCGFDSRIAAPSDDDVLVLVSVGFDQAVSDLGEILASYIELLRGAATSERQDDVTRVIFADRRVQVESVAVALNSFETLVGLHAHSGIGDDGFPDGEQRFL